MEKNNFKKIRCTTKFFFNQAFQDTITKKGLKRYKKVKGTELKFSLNRSVFVHKKSKERFIFKKPSSFWSQNIYLTWQDIFNFGFQKEGVKVFVKIKIFINLNLSCV